MQIGHIINMSSDMVEEILGAMEPTDAQEIALRKNLENGNEVAVLCMACDVDGDPEHAYFDVVFADGTHCEALAGEHIAGIKDWTEE